MHLLLVLYYVSLITIHHPNPSELAVAIETIMYWSKSVNVDLWFEGLISKVHEGK